MNSDRSQPIFFNYLIGYGLFTDVTMRLKTKNVYQLVFTENGIQQTKLVAAEYPERVIEFMEKYWPKIQIQSLQALAVVNLLKFEEGDARAR